MNRRLLRTAGEKEVGKSEARDEMQDPGEDVMEEIARARGFKPNPDVQPSDYAVGALRIALERAGKKGQDACNAFVAEYEAELRKAGITTEGDDAGKPGRK